MPIYQNPYIGQAISNIAQLFAPPSAGDMAAGAQIGLLNAKTTSEKQQAGRLAEFYGKITDPNTPRDMADRYGIGAGAFNPSQGYYSVDTQAATSRANNTADNARALQQTEMQQRGDTERSLLAPVGPGATRFVPKSIGDMYQLPSEQVGVIEAQPGETVVTPDGRTVNGAPKPLSETEWRAGQSERLRQSGAINDQQIVNSIMGDTPVETVLGSDGKPRIVARPDAIGQQPAPKVQELSGVGKLITERDALPAADPRRAEYDRAISASGSPRQETAYDQEIGRQFAQGYQSITTKADAARQGNATLDALDQALSNPDVVTGALGPTALGLRRAAVALGIGDADTVADSELVRTIGNQLALQLRNPETGMGMPGAVSDRDLQFLQQSVPGLANSVAGNRQLIGFMRRLNQRSMEVEQLANEYAQRNGRLDTGFREQLAQWAAANPLFPEAQAAIRPVPAGRPAPQSSGPAANVANLPEGTVIRGPDGQRRVKQNGTWMPHGE